MHPYIPHLLADIAAAHRAESLEEIVAGTIEEHLEEIEKCISGDKPEKTFGYYCGLEAMNFPPPEQLNDDEMILIRKAFERMMYTWNHGIDLPKKLPVAFAYKMIVGTLNMHTTIVNSGDMTFDFCSGSAPDCIFKEYCSCLKYWNNQKDTNAIHRKMDSDQGIEQEDDEDSSAIDFDTDIPF